MKRRHYFCTVEMGDLPQSMNARIGSSRARNDDGFAGKAEDGFLQFFLKCRAIKSSSNITEQITQAGKSKKANPAYQQAKPE